jgi:hypothetical protein
MILFLNLLPRARPLRGLMFHPPEAAGTVLLQRCN